MIRTIAVIISLSVLSACQTTSDNSDEQLVIYRADGLKSDTPERSREIEEARAVCLPRAEAMGLAAAAPINRGNSLAGSIVTGLEQRATGTRVAMLHLEACLAERGLRIGTRAFAEAYHIAKTEERAARR